MRIIVCNIQMFSNDQIIQTYDTEQKQATFAQKVDIDNLPGAICALANQYGITEVRLGSSGQYSLPLVDEIKTTYALNYSNKTLNVEVI